MRALLLKHPNQPETLAIHDVPLPEPEPGQVRVRFTSMGMNRADLLYCQGRYFFPTIPCSRLGFEGAGVIDKLGENVDSRRFHEGDRVAILPMSFDIRHQGCYAEYGVYDETSLIPCPTNLEDLTCGAAWMAYLTAWGGLIDCGNLTAGETVVITAASSSVGIAAIQVAKLYGAKVIATTSDAAKCAELYTQGADHVLVFPARLEGEELDKANTHYVNEVREFTSAKGSDLVFDAVAGPASYGLVKASATGGRIVIQGMLDRRPMNIHAGVLMKRRLTLRGYTLNETLENSSQKNLAINAITSGLQNEQLKPLIARTFKLESFAEAFDELKLNQHIGKILMIP